MRKLLARLLAPENIERTKRYAAVAACVVALVAVVAHEMLGRTGYLARRQRRMQIQTLSEEILKLKQENMALDQKIKNLRSDPDTIEKLAREQLRLGRPGDVIVSLPPAAQMPPASATTPSKR